MAEIKALPPEELAKAGRGLYNILDRGDKDELKKMAVDAAEALKSEPFSGSQLGDRKAMIKNADTARFMEKFSKDMKDIFKPSGNGTDPLSQKLFEIEKPLAFVRTVGDYYSAGLDYRTLKKTGGVNNRRDELALAEQVKEGVAYQDALKQTGQRRDVDRAKSLSDLAKVNWDRADAAAREYKGYIASAHISNEEILEKGTSLPNLRRVVDEQKKSKKQSDDTFVDDTFESGEDESSDEDEMIPYESELDHGHIDPVLTHRTQIPMSALSDAPVKPVATTSPVARTPQNVPSLPTLI
jgi:hypothetical protein